jgi:hypothetical protein
MMSRRLVFAGAMMFSCFVTMFRRVFMVFSSLRVNVPLIFVALYVLLPFSGLV